MGSPETIQMIVLTVTDGNGLMAVCDADGSKLSSHARQLSTMTKIDFHGSCCIQLLGASCPVCTAMDLHTPHQHC